MKWIGSLKTFMSEVIAELKKCAWPTKSELYDSTIVVIVSVILLGAYVGASDAALNWLLSLVIR